MTSVSITIHRSAHEIGGNCIEVATGAGHRLVLDAGRPLDTPEGQSTPIPPTLDVSRIPDAVLLSHAHQDHVGLLRELPESWPVWCGEPTGSLMRLLGNVLGQPVRQNLSHWGRGQCVSLGPFQVTPMLVDHSAFDAHMLLIEVHGKHILYTGDFRDHGRKGHLVDAILGSLPQPLDVLIMEGTNLGSNKTTRTEFELEEDFLSCFRVAKGRAFISWSAMNIDRTVTIYKACRKAKRTLVLDLFSAEVLQAVAHSGRIPQPDWANVKVVVTRPLALRLETIGRKGLVEAYIQKRCAISAKALEQTPERWVILSRGSLTRSFKRSGVAPTSGDAWIWSQWRGYLKEKDGLLQAEFYAPCRRQSIHTSGHASEQCLSDFAGRVHARHVIPIHGEKWDAAPDDIKQIVRLRDGDTFFLSDH